jgi:bacterioferritin
MATATHFLSDIQTLRTRALRHIELGAAVTEDYRPNPEVVLRLLNEALATEIVCGLRCKRRYVMAKGARAGVVAAEFLEQASEEQGHADLIAARIVQLGGSPDFDPQGLVTRSHSDVEGDSLVDMIREDLVAERVAIDSYGEMVRYIGDADPTTRGMLEGILATEERRAGALANLLDTVDATKEGRS